MEMTSSKPYLIRAIHEWIIDNGLTPYVLVNAQYEGVEVPVQYVQDGKIVLNIAPRAVDGLELGNDFILFRARFSGAQMSLVVPIPAVLAIYCQENGQGMAFPEDEGTSTPPPSTPGKADKTGRPSLKVVK